MPTRAPHPPTTKHQAPPGDGSCLGRTCLHWRADGELFEDDMALVLQRLRAVDGPAARGDFS
jgi:hypothetical protein